MKRLFILVAIAGFTVGFWIVGFGRTVTAVNDANQYGSQGWDACTAGQRSSVYASFTVPYVSGGEGHSVALWVGLGNGPGIEQTGFTMSERSGRTVVNGWYELYPADPHPYGGVVHAHDNVGMYVADDGGGKFTTTIHDYTAGWAAGKISYDSRPTVNVTEAVAEGYGPPLAYMAPTSLRLSFSGFAQYAELSGYSVSCGNNYMLVKG